MLRLLCIYSLNGQVISTPMQSFVFHFKKGAFHLYRVYHPILNLYFPSYKSETQKLFYSYLNHDLKKRNLIDKIFLFQIYHAEP